MDKVSLAMGDSLAPSSVGVPVPRPRVVIAVRGLRRGGAERLVYEEAVELARRGFPVEVWYQLPGEFASELAEANIPVRQVRLLAIRRELQRARERSEQLVVHTHSPSLGGLVRLTSLGISPIRFIHTEHNLPSGQRRVSRLLHRASAARIDELVAVSHAVAQVAPHAKSNSVIYHISLNDSRMRSLTRVRPKLTGDLKVLCVASLTQKKDHSNLLRALEQIDYSRWNGVKVLLVGDGPLRKAVASAAHSLAERTPGLDIEVCGVRDDIARLLAESDIFVLPSRQEGLPLAVVEAMAAARPVLATSVGGVPELVDHGVTGLLVPPGDSHALAQRLCELLDEPNRRTEMGEAGRTRYTELAERSWVDAYVDLILRASESDRES